VARSGRGGGDEEGAFEETGRETGIFE